MSLVGQVCLGLLLPYISLWPIIPQQIGQVSRLIKMFWQIVILQVIEGNVPLEAYV